MPALTVTVQAIPNSGPAPLTVYFAATVAGGTPPYSFEWIFGDNSPPATTQDALHTYAAGTYTAYCEVTDSVGAENTSSPIPITVSAAVPPATFTPLSGQVCAAGVPGPLTQIPAGVANETIPAGAANEQLPVVGYYNRCLGEFIGKTSVPEPVVVTSVSNLDGTLAISPTTGDVIASLNLGNGNTWSALQTFGAGITGSGSTGALTAGTGILAHGNTWTAAQTFNAAVTMGSTIALNAGGSLAGTFSGTPTFSGNLSFTGYPGFTGGAHFDTTAVGFGVAPTVLYSSAVTYPITLLAAFTTAQQVLGLANTPANRLVVGTGFSGGVATANNTLDDGSGNAYVGGNCTFGGSVTVTGSFNPGAGLSANFATAGFNVSFGTSLLGSALEFLDAHAANAVGAALFTSAVTIAAGYTFSVAAISNSSDSRLKNDFSAYDADPLRELAAVRFGHYRHMRGVDLGSWRAGVAAETLPDSVRDLDPEGYYAVRSPDSFAWLTGVCRALLARVEALENGVASARKAS